MFVPVRQDSPVPLFPGNFISVILFSAKTSVRELDFFLSMKRKQKLHSSKASTGKIKPVIRSTIWTPSFSFFYFTLSYRVNPLTLKWFLQGDISGFIAELEPRYHSQCFFSTSDCFSRNAYFVDVRCSSFKFRVFLASFFCVIRSL